MAERILMAALSPTMEEGVIAKWNKKEGDKVKEGDVICEVETDKATVEYEATFEGTILKITKGVGSQTKVGEMIGVFGKEGEDFSALLNSSIVSTSAVQVAPVSVKTEVKATAPTSPDARVKISPLAKKLATEKGIDFTKIKGTGPAGRIVRIDVENFKGETKSATASASAPAKPESARVVPKLEDKVIPVAGKRKVIAARLSESKFTSPHYYLSNPVNMEKMIEARNLMNTEFKDAKISFNALFIKFCAEAILKYPEINSSFQGENIIQYGSIDIGLAVDINGLITPIIKDASSKGIVQIEEELKVLIDKVKKGTLQPTEYTGATFTISSLGGFGIEKFAPIINPPGSAILGIGTTTKKPVVDANDNIVVKPICELTLSADHRNIDGKLGGMFLSELCKMLENPIRALF